MLHPPCQAVGYGVLYDIVGAQVVLCFRQGQETNKECIEDEADGPESSFRESDAALEPQNGGG